ncbi:MAG: hypothetical protein Q7S87_08525 [Agitococcus sp.]|nr:hypothetical protein [Agitococcus sp.]
MQDCADMEAWHLKHDCIILFPVKGEAYGFGSLAEVGFVIRTEIDNTDFRFVLMFIEPAVSAELVDHCPGQADGSRRARQLVLARLSQVDLNARRIPLLSSSG